MVERILHLDLNDCSDVAFLTQSGIWFHGIENTFASIQF